MEGYFPLRLKRKDLEDVSEDFSDFSLSSPARKIRRLDAELPPIIEEEEPDIQIEFEQPPILHEQSFGSNLNGGIRIEELPDEPINEERAIVLFNPNTANPLLQSPSNFTVSVDPSLVSGIKNQALWSNQSNPWKLPDQETSDESGTHSSNSCLAMVPWVPSQAPVPEIDGSEMMDAEEVGEASMEVEEANNVTNQSSGSESGGVNLKDQIQQWQQQQQHCLFPQPLQNTTTPVVWYQ